MPAERNDPGLNVQQLLALRVERHDLGVIRERIAAHLDTHEGYVAFSGGKDSTVVLDLARQVDPEVPVVFFDSSLEFPETYEYVQQLAQEWCLNLRVIPAQHNLLEELRP